MASTVSVMVIVELFSATVAEEMSWPGVNTSFGGEEVLNSKPGGAFRRRVRPEPASKSPLKPSVMTIGPKVVHAGELALAALSAGMAVPPVAGVTITLANAEASRRHPHNKASRKNTGTRWGMKATGTKARRFTQPEQTSLAETARTL